MSTLACGVVNTTYSAGLVNTVTSGGTIGTSPLLQIGPGGSPTTLSGDPRVLNFKHGSNEYALIVSYTYSTIGSPGAAVYGIYQYNPSTSAWNFIARRTSAATGGNWNVSNPYGLVVIGDFLYVQDYDSTRIAKVNLAGANIYDLDSTITITTTDYPLPTGYTAHGNGLDYYGGNLVAIYNKFDASYNYGAAKLFLINPSTGAKRGSVDLNANAVAVTVNGDYAYVSSIGGSQPYPVGSNANSKLELVNLIPPPFPPSAPLTIAQTFSVTGPTTLIEYGNFVDVDFVGSNAYVLNEYYDYTTPPGSCEYQLIQVPIASLVAGSWSGNATTGYVTTTPAATTWLLAPATDALWFVSGDEANTVTTTGTFGSASVVYKADAAALGNTTINAHLNTAAVVVDAAYPYPLAAREAGVAASRTKFAVRLPLPDQEQEATAQSAASKQK